MVKGVNKSIIEINNTGSEVFERIVFYVSPKFSSLGAKTLQKATDEIGTFLNFDIESDNTLRLRIKRKELRKKVVILSSGGALLIGAALFVLFKFVL
ncbi:MAG: hypothetical protein MJ090_04595 [Clostridia bacterium]|nr:hypothetical protein [Clostridia bacterium]